ncbi:hypothetical protein [Breznakia pachnodae]|uniref:Uncharacterized protein n=1 Tax=Breznakia pachnodae TaxID=265178 RepID=A0ABU0DZH1_9FIRM|nr:hypothetical protein [Breznakia pachnodae]MDQ0359940.1 hypothetical protein [Breznakia pachnodae]
MIAPKKHLRSSDEELSRRGYIDHLDISEYQDDFYSNVTLLNDKDAVNRSIAARKLSTYINEKDTIQQLLTRLLIEKALYTKLEICNSLSKADKDGVTQMLPYLGIIPNKQYTSLPDRGSKKKSFPLSRDIIARTIGRMDITVLITLLNAYNDCTLIQKRELLDAIGYLIFTNNYKTAIVFGKLKYCFEHETDEVIRWKIVIIFKFLLPYSKAFLEQFTKEDGLLYEEAQKVL